MYGCVCGRVGLGVGVRACGSGCGRVCAGVWCAGVEIINRIRIIILINTIIFIIFSLIIIRIKVF